MKTRKRSRQPSRGGQERQGGFSCGARPGEIPPGPQDQGQEGRRAQIYLTEELWAELQALYEGAGYSQRDVVNYARSRRGVVISQAAICRRATEHGWVKGTRKAELYDAASTRRSGFPTSTTGSGRPRRSRRCSSRPAPRRATWPVTGFG
jgi:hypothetical protein